MPNLILPATICFLTFNLASAFGLRLSPLNRNNDVFENVTYVLTCSLVSGFTDLPVFEWTHNGHKLTNNSNIHLENSAKFSLLTFRNIQRQQAGLFECRVTNSLGEFDVTQTQVNVQGDDDSISNHSQCGTLFSSSVAFICHFMRVFV